jgi:hypothetical protein
MNFDAAPSELRDERIEPWKLIEGALHSRTKSTASAGPEFAEADGHDVTAAARSHLAPMKEERYTK